MWIHIKSIEICVNYGFILKCLENSKNICISYFSREEGYVKI